LTWFGFSLVTSKEAFPALTGRKSLLSHSPKFAACLAKKENFDGFIIRHKKKYKILLKKIDARSHKKNVK